MPDDLDARLAEAVTDEEAKAAMDAAIRHQWGLSADQYSCVASVVPARSFDILHGNPAGWIGVGVLMLGDRVAIDGWGWQVSVEPLNETSAHANVFGTLPWDNGERPSWGASAKRPDCALVLACRRASPQGSER